MKRYCYLACFLMVLLSPFANSADWSGCADDLDRLSRASLDASGVANDVKSKAAEFKNCRSSPSMYDHMQDGCRSAAYHYQSALRNLESELSTVESRVRSVGFSCDVNLPTIASPSLSKPNDSSAGNSVCDLYRIYKNKLSPEELLKTCMRSMSEADCQKCLSK